MQQNEIYTILCTLFAVLVVTSNLIYQKFVYLPILPFHTFELSVGAIFYPLTFLITNLITEFYGKLKAKFCIRLALIMNILVSLILMMMNKLDATSWSRIDNDIFNLVFGVYNISLIGSLIANYTAQIVDINLYTLIRKLTNNKYLFLRNLSSAVSLFIDTAIVVMFVTIFGVIPYSQMMSLIFNSYSFKLLFVIVTIPLFYLSVYMIRKYQS
ncbi:queuosine precursor transporter [Rickettsia endosymbiont of Halotydeus destructor]|uniref:queuosine precursor transporter n=1 Tax=Rickettsia endosymbiont of Halotydeus destructor TaxID=2996754 RepID=UPI003BB0F1E2